MINKPSSIFRAEKWCEFESPLTTMVNYNNFCNLQLLYMKQNFCVIKVDSLHSSLDNSFVQRYIVYIRYIQYKGSIKSNGNFISSEPEQALPKV